MADISQTRANRLTKEDLVGGKENKLHVLVEKNKTAALLQPAQKPIANNKAIGQIPYITEVSEDSKVKQVISKRATTIFKDYSTLSQSQDAIKSAKTTRQSMTIKADSTVPEVDTKAPVVEIVESAILPTVSPPEVAIVDLEPNNVDSLIQFDDFAKTTSKETSDEEQPKVESIHSSIEPIVTTVSPSALPLESEHFVDEDFEEEEVGEDDGYVTARSFRSKGENITYTNFTALVPVTNSNIKREIEAAAAVVNAMKPPTEAEDEEWDCSMVSEYRDEIFEYYRELEVKLSPNPHYMDTQAEIQWSMRSVLIDWVVQVHDRFQLLPETLFLCVNLIDRFLSVKVVSINKLQLVGATALFIAAKYEEVNCPTLNEMVFMVDSSYTGDEILKAERFMLSLLKFDLGWPGPMSFLRRISTADDYDLETRTVAKYFLELTIMDERFLGCPPSFIAAGAHCLSRLMLNKGHWVSLFLIFRLLVTDQK
jgi:G2/mitotic-specific cyclin 3/4